MAASRFFANFTLEERPFHEGAYIKREKDFRQTLKPTVHPYMHLSSDLNERRSQLQQIKDIIETEELLIEMEEKHRDGTLAPGLESFLTKGNE